MRTLEGLPIKRIVYITDSTEHGGAEEHLKTIALHFHRKGYDICFAIPSSLGTEDLVRETTAEGVRIHHTRMVPLNSRDINILRSVFYFCRYFLRERPNLIHFVLPWPTRDMWCGMLAANLLRIKYIVDFQLVPPEIRCPPTHRGILKHLRKILTFLFRRANALICVSEGNKDRLIHFFDLRKDSVRVIPNCVDMGRFERPDPRQVEELRRSLGVSPNLAVVTMVARLNVQKDHECLIQAAKKLNSDTDGLVFLLVGDGELADALKRLVEEFGLNGKFIFAGYRKEIPQILALTDIFVLPTRFEGLPHSLLEAMAAGRCVVASRVDGISEAVTDGETGILVEPGNADQLARAIATLIARKEQREQMGLKGKQRVKAHFKLDQMLSSFHKLYQETLSKLGHSKG